jgi:uncharacterized repeat protein (TIGR02543 family)
MKNFINRALVAKKHLKLFFALFAMLALGVGNAWGAETLYKNALFKIANCTNNSSYTGKVTCTIGDDSWVAQNAANNNGGWDYVKIGAKKSKASDPTKVTTGTITTNAAYAEAVSKIVVNGQKDRGSFTSKLIIASNSSFTTDKVEITGATSFTNNQIVFTIPSPSANKYYKLEFVCSNTTTSNGVIQVSSVEYYYEPSSEEPAYSVTVTQPAEGGSIEADKNEAKAGDIVKLTATPSAGYNFDTWTVTGASGNVSVTDNQFTMPAEEVTVTASFVEKTKHTISWSVNGATKTLTPANVYEGDALGTLPTLDPSDICTGKVFVGWTTEANKDYKHATDAPEFITKDTKPSANTTYYAVFATEGEGAAEPEEVTWSYDFSLFSGTSVQNKEETHDLGGGVIINIAGCHINTQLRIYSSNENNGYVISNKLPGTIKSMEFNAGYKVDALVVYGSADGNTWNQVGEVSVTSTSYKDYTLSFDATNYTYFKLDVKGTNQIRVAEMSITYMSAGGVTTTYSDYTTSCGATPTTYNVTIADGITNGTVTASPTSAAEGATITLTVTPADGYMLNTLAVADESSNLISLTDNTFEMPASNVTVSATFKEIPAATLTLSKNGDASDKIEGKVGDVITLPDFTSDCSKTFVGWDADANCATEPEYKAGNSYTLSATEQTLYAVYANAIEGALVNVFSETFDACEGKGGNDTEGWSGTGIAAATLTLDGWTCEKGNAANGCAKFGASSAKGSAETPAVAITGNATLSFRAGAWDNDSEVTTLNLSATGANLSQSSITLTKAAWTEYTIYITEATGSVKIKFEASVKDKNRFFLDDVVVSQASVTYSNYSTTCTAALNAPTFNPAAGTYNEVTNVTISATDGDVYYTLDGTTPTKESNKYTAPIVLNTNGTTTIKAIAISGGSQSSVVTATYTIKLPLTTMDEIFAAATTAGGAEAPVLIKMNNWVVSAVKEDGKTAYLTDGTKGLIIYTASHGFNVGDILSGTVACKVQLFKGSAELTELTATTEGLTITKGGTVSTVVVDDVTTLSGVNTGSVIKINGVHESGNIVNNVKLYNTLFSFENLTPGQEYNVTGVYLQYDATKEILPRSAADIEEVVGLPTATISIENITLVEGDEHTIVATITPDEAASKVTYSIKNGDEYISLSGNVITANAVGTATITAAIAEVDGVYHGTTKDFTVTVNEYVAPISGKWELVTDASTLKAGMEVIVAQYVVADGAIYTMGAQKPNNRDIVESTVSGIALTPTTGTSVLTLVDAGNGTFALQASNGNYLYAASTGSNHLKEKDEIDVNGQWTITIADSKATIKAEGSSNRNWIRYNSNDKLFSCYASGQKDIALYARVPDHIREVPVGYFATICVPNNIVKVVGATLYKVAGKENGKLYFDEVLVEETEEGMPYVFFTELKTQEFYFGTKTTSTAGKEKSLQGTFVKLEDEDLEGHYMLQSNKIIKCATTGCWIDPNRAYFDGNDLSSLGKPSAQMPDRRRVSMGAEEENETTGTENIVAPEGQTLKLIENGQLIIIRNGEKFNAQGVRL